MGQEALKAHDAWMEDVSQSLQEAHERSQQLSQDIAELRDQTQAKLDGKVDIVAWNDMNDDIDASIKTVRDMVSTLRLEVDSRRRKVDEALSQIRRWITRQMISVGSWMTTIRFSTSELMNVMSTATHWRTLATSTLKSKGTLISRLTPLTTTWTPRRISL